MPEPTPRQLLYAVVAGGFHLVVGVLAIASVPLAPTWWTIVVAIVWLAAALVIGLNWRRTALALALSLAGFAAWTVGATFVLT